MNVADPISHYTADAECFDYFAPQSGPDRDATVRIRQGVLHALSPRHGALLLDAGSGSGWLQQVRPGCTVVSVDLGMRNLHEIRARASSAPVVRADLERLPFRDGAFDGVVCSEVLEHCNAPARVVAELARCLHPGGRLAVSTPYRETIRTSLCIHCNRPTPVNAHLHSFDKQAHRAIFASAGIRPDRMRVIQNKVFLASRLSWIARGLPYIIWSAIDSFFTFVIPRAHTIVISGLRDYPPHTTSESLPSGTPEAGHSQARTSS